jgi:hypothetical protein
MNKKHPLKTIAPQVIPDTYAWYGQKFKTVNQGAQFAAEMFRGMYSFTIDDIMRKMSPKEYQTAKDAIAGSDQIIIASRTEPETIIILVRMAIERNAPELADKIDKLTAWEKVTIALESCQLNKKGESK